MAQNNPGEYAASTVWAEEQRKLMAPKNIPPRMMAIAKAASLRRELQHVSAPELPPEIMSTRLVQWADMTDVQKRRDMDEIIDIEEIGNLLAIETDDAISHLLITRRSRLKFEAKSAALVNREGEPKTPDIPAAPAAVVKRRGPGRPPKPQATEENPEG